MYIFVFSLSLCANYLWVFLLQKIMICVHYIGKRQYYLVLCCLHCCLVGLDCMIIFPSIRTEIKHASTRTHGVYCDWIGYFHCRAIQNLNFLSSAAVDISLRRQAVADDRRQCFCSIDVLQQQRHLVSPYMYIYPFSAEFATYKG